MILQHLWLFSDPENISKSVGGSVAVIRFDDFPARIQTFDKVKVQIINDLWFFVLTRLDKN
jgi:hypothetical protein